MSAPDTTTTGGFETITAAALEAWIANWLVCNADVPAATARMLPFIRQTPKKE